MDAMKRPALFRFTKKELLYSLPVMMVLMANQGLMLAYHFERFTRGGNLGFWSVFVPKFTLSGFDPYIYLTLSRWDVYYAVYRHPLLAYLWYPWAWLNHWLMMETGVNLSIFIVAGVHTLLAFYAYLFLFRILRWLVRVPTVDAWLLASFFFSFGYILLTVIVPDHFCLSMFLLLLTLYVAGSRLRDRRPLALVPTAALYLLTAGTTLSNGVYTFLAQWACNGRKVFAWRNLLLAFVVPTLLMFGLCFYQQAHIVKPRMERQQRALAQKEKAKNAAKAQLSSAQKQGKANPYDVFNLSRWLDTSTSRMASFVENFVGESVVLHNDHLLEDQLEGRPVIVTYSSVWNYIIIGVVLLLTVAGLALGWHETFMRMCASWMAFTLFLHFVPGFALKEVYIMGAHWLFFIPIALAYLLRRMRQGAGQNLTLGCMLMGTRVLLGVLMVVLYAHNLRLIATHLLAH